MNLFFILHQGLFNILIRINNNGLMQHFPELLLTVFIRKTLHEILRRKRPFTLVFLKDDIHNPDHFRMRKQPPAFKCH